MFVFLYLSFQILQAFVYLSLQMSIFHHDWDSRSIVQLDLCVKAGHFYVNVFVCFVFYILKCSTDYLITNLCNKYRLGRSVGNALTSKARRHSLESISLFFLIFTITYALCFQNLKLLILS